MTIALNTHNKQLERKATTMTHAQNTVANQYLNSILRVGAKPLMIISILLTAMFILAACGGGAAAPAAVTPTVNPCDTNPLGATGCETTHATERAALVRLCLGEGKANDPECAVARVEVPCIVNPQAAECATDEEFITYITAGSTPTTIAEVRNSRETFCEKPENRNTAAICGGVLAACNAANPFANDLCDTATGIAGLRTTYCTTAATLWNDNCDAGEATYGNATALRNTACETYGTDDSGTNNGDASCANRANIMTACTAATPFANEGCDDAADTIIDDDDRVAFCIDTTVGDGKNPFNAKCADSVALETAKNTACETYGTTADDTCSNRPNIMMACSATTPFANTGCDTADESIVTDANRLAYCITDATSFHVDCVDGTYGQAGDIDAARARLALACSAEDLTGVTGCDTFVDGESGTTIEMCSDNPFLAANGCGASDAFGAVRTSICTTELTSFNPNCVNDTHGEVDKTREALANKCLTMGTEDECTMTFVNGVSGTTIAMCSADPFSGADDCDGNIAFNGIRTGICTTEATLFNPNCTNANYNTSGAARAALIAECAVVSPPGKCATIYVDGSLTTGTSVATCITDPFNTGCTSIVDDTFATARTERNTLCAATGSPFDAACLITEFGTANDANRDTYCLTIAIEGDMDCAGTRSGGDTTDRLAEICGATDTHNPFALLCGDNTANRMTFCGLGTQSGNLDCLTDEAMLCARNPFGTNLGPAATVDCIAPSTGSYAAERLALAEACRLGTTPANGATCTVAIDRCNANPFSGSVFNGGACDQVAFAGAQVPYCVADANPWQANCDSLVAANDSIARARGDVCINNRAIPSSSQTSQPLAAGESLFNAICAGAVATDGTELETAQIGHCSMDENSWHTSNCGTLETSNSAITQARANICVDNKEIDKGDGSPILAGMSLFSADCENVTAADGVRTGMTARTAWCTVGDNIFDTQCGADDADTYGATTAARNTACATTGDTPLKSVGTDECASRADAICGISSAAGTNPFAAICSVATQNVNHVATLLDSQQAYCRDVANNPNEVCTSTIQAVCETGGNPITTTNAIFDGLCLGAEYETAQRTYCSVTAQEGDTDCDKTQPDATASIKDTLCDGAQTTDTPYATVCGANLEQQRTFCGLANNSGANGCAATIDFACDEATTTGNPFHVLCTANEADRIARADECRAGNAAGKMCDAAVNTCNGAPFGAGCDAAVYVNALEAYCTVGDNIFDVQCVDGTHGAAGAVNNARQAACNTIADVPVASVGTNECAGARALAICGTATMAGSNPFAAICNVLTQNANMATHSTAIAFYCEPAQGNLSNALCDNVTSGDWVLSNAAANSGAGLATTPTGDADNQTRNNEFLAIDGNTISTTGTTITQGGSDPVTTPTTLDFTAIKYNNEALTNLSATNGLAFFTGFHGDDTEESAYAGIYETTDLGEPITDNELNVTWHGALRILDGTVAVASDIALNVTFDGTDGTISGFLANINNAKDFYIDADFSNKGVIITSSSDIYYGELNDDSSGYTADNGRLSGIIGQDGAIGVFVSDESETDIYTGGFVVSGACSVNIFADGCSIKNDDNDSQTAFCTNAADNTGKNPFNPMCDTGGTVHGDVNAARVIACRAFGDAADDSCKNSDDVRRVCDEDPFLQTTGLATNMNLCTGTNVGGVDYSMARADCEAAGVGSFATKCDAQDQLGKVKESRDNYCRDVALATDTANCDAGTGHVDRIAEFCDEGTGTSIFSAVCAAAGTITAAQTTACEGAVSALTARGATLDNCDNNLLSGAICGMGTNPGSNPWADICDEADAIVAGFMQSAAQDAACLQSGSNAGAGNDCATRSNVEGVCNGNPYTQTGDGTTGNLCTTQTYITARSNCETAGTGSFNAKCDTQDQLGGVKTARDSYCRNTAPSTDTANCGAGTGHVDRIAEFCTAGTGTSIFSAVCTAPGTITAAQTTACEGAVSALTARGANAGNCNNILLSGAICGDASSNPGSNPWADICGNSSAIISGFDQTMAQNAACLYSGDNAGAGNDCSGRSNVMGLCNTNPYTQTGNPNDGTATICTATSYVTDRSNCETAGTGSFNAKCNTQDQLGGVKTARDSYCRNTAPSTDTANCGAGTGHVDRIAEFCTEGTGTSIFSAVCTAPGTITAAQTTACEGAVSALAARGANAGNCNNILLSGAICGTQADPTGGENVLAEICSESAALTTGFTPELVIAARNAICVDVVVGTNDTRPSGCGLEQKTGQAGSGYFKTYCTTPDGRTNQRDCPDRFSNYNKVNPVATVTTLTGFGPDTRNQAINSNGTGPLAKFLTTGTAATTNPATNFIQDVASGVGRLELGGAVPSQDSKDIAANFGSLTIESIPEVNSTNTPEVNARTGGFTFERAEFDGDTANDRLYVGLLYNTSLGGPLDGTEPNANGVWKTQYRVLTGEGAVLEANAGFSLAVSFTNKTIKTTGNPARFGTLGVIDVDGKFTAYGVIYGNVSFDGSNTNDDTILDTLPGTLTGLIGKQGAVGIFKSEPTGSGDPYVGGFVASPNTSPPVDCSSENGDPFHMDCSEMHDNDDEQTRACIARSDAATTGLGFDVNCVMNMEVTDLVCNDRNEFANPFHPTICPLDGKKKPLFLTATLIG